ncbi:hypothetical protein PC111_g11115 [Phytophthora cactorum]|nr:hypothetical protein PC112_g14624 [Phytophthora cactorum]KAG2821241.1 hypothetical protein PC111_g11115 [Phytophthora cactorum]KAG3158322.1 hypothetical protein C6341_g14439 [Phytophthora cactorum]
MRGVVTTHLASTAGQCRLCGAVGPLAAPKRIGEWREHVSCVHALLRWLIQFDRFGEVTRRSKTVKVGMGVTS